MESEKIDNSANAHRCRWIGTFRRQRIVNPNRQNKGVTAFIVVELKFGVRHHPASSMSRRRLGNLPPANPGINQGCQIGEPRPLQDG